MDRSPDPIDRAADISEEHNQDCIDAARRAAAPEQVRGPDGAWSVVECVDCGEDIEPLRLEAGRVRCFSCQELKERRNRFYVR